jgi:hypothetical protein
VAGWASSFPTTKKGGLGTMNGGDLLEHLLAENTRLIALLERHAIERRLPDELPKVEPVNSNPL